MSRASLSGDEAGGNKSAASNMSDSLSIFCREVRNLLRSKPNCMIPFSKFVPAYHNHYGRQCCVYQFGYTKLIELLEAIPHVVQIIGDGTNRYITLTHREQIKRFASDLIKVVKSQPGKKLKLSQFAKAYEQVLGYTFRLEDYGTDDINVLLAEIWEGTINIIPIKREHCDDSVRLPLFDNSSHGAAKTNAPSSSDTCFAGLVPPNKAKQGASDSIGDSLKLATPASNVAPSAVADATSSLNQQENNILNRLIAASRRELGDNKPYITDRYPDSWLEIPKRERSEKEIKRTRYFVWDVIDLLSSLGPTYSVPFSKFIPYYHYYFNRQCKVSVFGFSKLIDLFECISPDVVEIVDLGHGEEKIIKLASRHIPQKTTHSTPHARHRGRQDQPTKANRLYHYATKITPPRCPISSSLAQTPAPLAQAPTPQPQPVIAPTLMATTTKTLATTAAIAPPTLTSASASTKSSNQDRQSDGYSSPFREDDEENATDESSPGELSINEAIDNGPTEEELIELEDELQAYEEMQALQKRRSARMAASLDVFKFPVC